MRTILFYPDMIRGGRVLWALNKAGFVCHNNPTLSYDVFFYWSYHRSSIPPNNTAMERQAINWRLYDISKTRVNSVFNNISIDPLSYIGVAVQKSELQGSHSGRLIHCPISKKQHNPNHIYQKYIHAQVGGLYVTHRLFYDGDFRFVSTQYSKSMFESDYVLVELNKPTAIFTSIYLRHLKRKCIEFGLEFGEIDVLRDATTKHAYVVDVNNVPGMRQMVMDVIGNAYLEMFINFINSYTKKYKIG